MSREAFLTVRWNNYLSAGLGIPTVVYIAVVAATSSWTDWGALAGLGLIGAVF